MALLNFNHYFFIAIFLIIAVLIFVNIKYHKKVKKISINPIDLALGIIFFLSLWVFDLVSLKMVDRGLDVVVGVNSGTKMSAIIVYSLAFIAMSVIAFYYSVENKRVTRSKGFMKLNKAFIYILSFGLFFSLIFSLLMIYFGAGLPILIFDALGAYHLSLSFIILAMTFLLLDLN